MVLHEKNVDFEATEVDLKNKSREFLDASPTGKVPVIVLEDGDSLYESNVINEYLEEVFEGAHLLPDDSKGRAYARIWMGRADNEFFPQVFAVGRGSQVGLDKERIAQAVEALPRTLARLEGTLKGREYLLGDFSLADIAYAGNFQALRDLQGDSEIELEDYPGVLSWMDRVQSRESFRAAY